MKIGIFSTSTKAYAPQRLYQEALKLNLEPELISFYDLNFKIKNGEVSVFCQKDRLSHFDAVIFRGGTNNVFSAQRNFLITQLEAAGTIVINSKSCQKWPKLDKLTQHFLFSNFKLPYIDTEAWGRWQDLANSMTTFPLILKTISGSRGRQVFKISNSEQITSLESKYPAYTLIKQPFLETGEDIRVIVLGGKAIGAMKRIAPPGAYLTNYSAGGEVLKYDLINDLEAKKIAESAASVTLTDYAGVDLMKDAKGQWLLLEVNRDCQFEGFEKSTGINVAKTVTEYLLNKNQNK